LLDVLRPVLERDAMQGERSSAGVIEHGVRLAISLRILAGGSHWDLMDNFRVGRTTVYQVFHETIDAMFQRLQLPGIPSDLAELDVLADGFNRSRPVYNPLNGCISAVDGIAIALRSPQAEYLPSLYYCRKGFYALPVQASCDVKYRFQYFSARAAGSTRDSLAFALSSLYTFLEEGGLPPCYWIAGDSAYTCTEYLLTPYSKAALLLPGSETSRDAYNFYHSSHRVHIEQAFGLLVRRFGIFWRPLAFDLPRYGVFVGVAMGLHNWCINHNAKILQETREARKDYKDVFSRW
jgi:DDE superfamily endonuclease